MLLVCEVEGFGADSFAPLLVCILSAIHERTLLIL